MKRKELDEKIIELVDKIDNLRSNLNILLDEAINLKQSIELAHSETVDIELLISKLPNEDDVIGV